MLRQRQIQRTAGGMRVPREMAGKQGKQGRKEGTLDKTPGDPITIAAICSGKTRLMSLRTVLQRTINSRIGVTFARRGPDCSFSPVSRICRIAVSTDFKAAGMRSFEKESGNEPDETPRPIRSERVQSRIAVLLSPLELGSSRGSGDAGCVGVSSATSRMACSMSLLGVFLSLLGVFLSS